MSIVKSLKNLFYFFQKTEQTNSEFHEDFMALVEVIEEYAEEQDPSPIFQT
jgi:hypothetical protein